MARHYVFVRMNRLDYEKIIKEKKIPMENELKNIVGKKVIIKNPQLFKIASNSTWDLGYNYKDTIVNSIKLKKRGFKL